MGQITVSFMTRVPMSSKPPHSSEFNINSRIGVSPKAMHTIIDSVIHLEPYLDELNIGLVFEFQFQYIHEYNLLQKTKGSQLERPSTYELINRLEYKYSMLI
jgi:hypothetical protein